MALRLPDSWSNWNLEMLVFEERGKPEYPEKNLSEQRREPTTNSTHIRRRRRDLNPGHIGGRRALSPLRHPSCSPGPWTNSTRARASGIGESNTRIAAGRGKPFKYIHVVHNSALSR